MLDLTEELFPLCEAPRHHPVAPVPHVSTYFRWAFRGVGPDRVKLETVKLGGRRYTSRAALTRFVAKLTGEAEAREALAKERTGAYRDAEREADREGI
jgi:hypothetical protein